MNLDRQKSYLTYAWLIIGGVSLLRLLYAGAFALVPDEAYYWQWSRYLALGYHDHPPAIAWMIYISTSLFGQTETAVRLPIIISQAIASIYLFLMAARWINARTAFYTVVLTQSILGFNVASLLATPDSPLLMGWAGTVYHLGRAYDEGNVRHWLLGGVWFGIGMLGKYTIAILPLFVFIAGLLDAKSRSRLARPWPYLGLLLGLLVFSPVIFWNMSHHWNTFRHAAHKGGADQGWTLHLNYMFEFIGSQAGLLSPLVFILLICGWYYLIKRTTDEKSWLLKYLFLTSFPLPILFMLLSLHTRVEGNWAAPGYLTAMVIIGVYIDDLRRKEISDTKSFSVRLWPWAIVSSYLLTGLVLLQVVQPVIHLPVRMDRISRETLGWDEMGQRIFAMKEKMPNPEKTFLFGSLYQTASELAFYAPGKPRTVAINRWTRPNTYDYWWDDQELIGWDAVGVGKASSKQTEQLKQIFERVLPPEKLDIYRNKGVYASRAGEGPIKEYYLYRAFGFKGGFKWAPQDSSDIREGAP